MDIKIKQINSNGNVSNYKHKKINFKGRLETDFFNTIRNGNKQAAIKFINNIKFDVFEKDAITGNNFLHFVCLEGTQDFFNKALKLLKLNKDKIETILETKNKEDKKPLDYTKNQNFISTVTSLISIKDFTNTQEANLSPANIPDETINNIEPEQKVGNEITEEIEIEENLFEDDFDFSEEPKIVEKSGFNALIGLSNLKGILEDEIIKPLKNSKNVFTNGFLIHGFSGNGKTFAIEKLAEELNREIIDSTLLISKLDKEGSDKTIEELIDKSIIKINPDEIREIYTITDLLKKHYKRTNKQGFIFIDEIQKFFPSENQFLNNIKAIQAIENSSKNGMVLIATTRDQDSIEQNVLNSLRFEKLIEVRPPKLKEILEILKQKITNNIAANEFEILAKKLSGFSYNDIVRIVERTQYSLETPSFQDYDNEIKKYAQEHSIQDLTDEGTTSAYDTYLKRVILSANAPKSLEDVIGMKEVKSKLKKVFNPIKKSGILEVFYKINKINKPNGILLYGPPGCGKTFIMNAIAADTKLPMYQVKISDLGSSYYNQTEKNIKKVFDQLRKKYRETGEASILFFDECDSIFGKSTNEANTKILNTLKEEMNNAGNDGIFVVAATNEKDNLNTAITRDGRFDSKIEVGYPDEEARVGLIRKALESPVLSLIKSDEKIQELAKITKGLSNASICNVFSTLKYEKASILSEKANSTEELNQLLEESPIKYDDIKTSFISKKEEINKLKLKQKDRTGLEWQAKTAAYDEYLDRTYYSANDPKSLDDVIGMQRAKNDMMTKVLAPLNPILKKIYDENNLPMSSGIILHGPGGVGKTFIVKATAAESKLPLYELKISEIGSKYMNETSNNIQKIFNQLKRKYRETGEASILFLDECDSLLGKTSDEGNTNRDRMNVINTLKDELANASNNGIVVIAATNEYKTLDKNVIRSGRFNDHIKIDYPDSEAREAYIKTMLLKRNITKDIVKNKEAVNTFVKLTDNMSNADIKTIIDNAAIESQKDLVSSTLKTFRQNGAIEDLSIKNKNVEVNDIIKQIEIKQAELQEQRGLV